MLFVRGLGLFLRDYDSPGGVNAPAKQCLSRDGPYLPHLSA